MRRTKRPTNKCGKCKYTWHPRGHNRSASCPRCGSPEVKIAGSALLPLIGILVIAFVGIGLFSGGNNDTLSSHVSVAPESTPVATRAPKAARELKPANTAEPTPTLLPAQAAADTRPTPPPEPQGSATPLTAQPQSYHHGLPIRQIQPVYPESARAENVTGEVKVQVEIDEEGKVTSAKAVSGNSLLRDAAEQAAKQWLYEPTLMAGKRVKTTGSVTFNFPPQ